MKMNWTFERPTQPGIYWYKNAAINTPYIVQICFRGRAEGDVLHLGFSETDLLSDMACLHGAMWCGPITYPAIPWGAV